MSLDNPGGPLSAIAGYRLMKQSDVTAEMTAFAVQTLKEGHPIGYRTPSVAFGDVIIIARVEWHAPAALIPHWHHGVTLYQHVDQAPEPSSEPSRVQGTTALGHVGAVGVDTAAKLNASSATKLKLAGVHFALRYVSISTPRPGDLTTEELREVLGAGLALMGVQHVRYPGWVPTAQMGAMDGVNAAKNAKQAGLLAGTTLWCDIEGEAGTASAADTIAYAAAWFNAVKAAGYEPGVYVGAGVPLTSSQWYELPFTRYWKSLSLVPTPAPRDFCMIQLYPTTKVAGIDVDLDVIQSDRRGGYPRWMASNHA